MAISNVNILPYACREGIASLGRDLAGPEPDFVLRETKATVVRRADSHWEVRTEDGRIFCANALVMTPPPPQSAELLAEVSPEAVGLLQSLPMSPCLALAVRYPRRQLPWRGIQAPDDPVVSWIGHDTSKRADLHPDTTVLVIHASPDFSGRNYGADENTVVLELLERAGKLAGADLASPQSFFLQRWRYALGPETEGEPARLMAGVPPLVLAGDAIAGGKIEGAWLSGKAAAKLLS
ncbi:MAG: NAD(P)/FAD-dependent oxidoreductase [Sphaerospermopsis kisseleviana]